MPTAFMKMGCTKCIYLRNLLLIILYLDRSESIRTVFTCPPQCLCHDVSCSQDDISCISGLAVSCYTFREELFPILPSEIKSLTFHQALNSSELASLLTSNLGSVRYLSLQLPANFHLDLDHTISPISELLYLNISYSSIQSIPKFIQIFPNLKHLALHHNALHKDLRLSLDSNRLETLDLSGNTIETFSLRGDLRNVHTVLLNDNNLREIPDLKHLGSLKVLDISNNKFALNSSTVVPLNPEGRVHNCIQTLPGNISSLYLRNNFLWKVPEKACGLWTNLKNLEHLFLENNSLLYFTEDILPQKIYDTLLSLMLDNNKIRYISPNALNRFKRLKLLSLNNNNLGHIPMPAVERSISVSIRASGNRFSCDCRWKDFLRFMGNNTSNMLVRDDFVCCYPQSLHGTKILDLDTEDLYCTDVALKPVMNMSCDEYEDCVISCVFDGLPHAHTSWISPSGEHIYEEALLFDANLRASYGLSRDGQKLTIFNLDYYRTGVYTCTGNNSDSWTSGKVQVGVMLAPLGSIVAIVVSGVSFLIAIVLNSVNLCCYYCEHLSEKKAKREANAESTFKMESPLKSKQKGLHESEASLNANKYYRKYDFTCQQVFLDTVIKGAHTVKRTLYDAKNSEFSNNVWEYASHLRDRLHIELPSTVQLPRVSMPSISMPSISMPSMPNFQSINTNIERLGTSVMHRSHNLASSVGSVLTLRWLRSGNSDNESDSDSDAVGFSEVRVHVHKSHDAMSKQDFSTTSENPAQQEMNPNSDSASLENETRHSFMEKRNSLQRKSVRFNVKNQNIQQDQLDEESSSLLESRSDVMIIRDSDSVENAHVPADSFQYETTV